MRRPGKRAGEAPYRAPYGGRGYDGRPVRADGYMVSSEPARRRVPVIRVVLGVLYVVAGLGVVGALYETGCFVVTWAQNQSWAPSWVSLSSIPAWIVAVVLLMCVFAALRSVATVLWRLVRDAFKSTQSDTATVVLAVFFDAAMCVVAGWLTSVVVPAMSRSGWTQFFAQNVRWATCLMFCAFAASLVWIPRVGVYGENQLGQFDDDNGRNL